MSIPGTSITQAQPSPNNQGPEDYADLANMISKVMSNAMMKMEDCLPVTVVSYNRTANTAIVQPMIQVVTTSGNFSRGQVGPIPVFAFGAGNFLINFPIAAGNTGWIHANDRDISTFLSSLQQQNPPNTYRQHSFNDAVFYPDIIKNFADAIAGEDGNMVISSVDGTIKISLGAAQLHLKHPTLVTVDAPNSQFNGNVTATGTITGQTDVVADGLSMKNHYHKPGTFVAGGTPVTGQSTTPTD